ncbi:phytoene desaturase family protein [Ferruginibacter paludis]|uniref:1-hydroxycarotenoid 3,4-desaturase CrtD n=1 Tax=Ferruginibacter paludis TaxID=1310417 RepID=UPI0025B5DBA1|nr:1-hydroxycarotenoid 3,4-desaturase CrtD [Ferruginibacter paludis]MDN3658358.1 phytoene desaturase family protein [Ferruginibacter paludis]
MHKKKAIIIGSGIGGMAVGIRLAVQGFDVSVYEKNRVPGGKLSAFEQDGYYFDAGPSLFTQPQNIVELFELANEPMEQYFSYESVPIACKYFYENGKVIHAHTDATLFAKELKEQLNEPPENVISYLKNAEKLYNNIGTVFLNNSLHKAATWFNKRIFPALKTLRPDYLLKSMNQYNSKHFASPEAVQLFNRFATYNGSNPYKAPAMLSLIPHLEQNQGTFYPHGGMISITNALHQLAVKKGVQFYFNTPVQQIMHADKAVQGVLVNKNEVNADVVVSNGDIYFTYKNLLNNPLQAKNVLKQERSSSAIIFYWGISKPFPQLHLHNILFSKDYKTEFDHIFEQKKLIDDPTIYINITSKMEAGQCPEGKENWFVMVNAPANTGQSWDELKTVLRKNVISKLKRMLKEDIESFIETEQTLDPVMIESQTASYMGSLYGTSSNSRLAAFFRPSNFSNALKGLYFCGGSVHPGGGIPLCLKSAKIVSELIAANHPKQAH